MEEERVRKEAVEWKWRRQGRGKADTVWYPQFLAQSEANGYVEHVDACQDS